MRAMLISRPSIRIVSVACGAFHTLAISETGSVWSCGRNQDGQLGNGTFADGPQLHPVLGIRCAFQHLHLVHVLVASPASFQAAAHTLFCCNLQLLGVVIALQSDTPHRVLRCWRVTFYGSCI